MFLVPKTDNTINPISATYEISPYLASVRPSKTRIKARKSRFISPASVKNPSRNCVCTILRVEPRNSTSSRFAVNYKKTSYQLIERYNNYAASLPDGICHLETPIANALAVQKTWEYHSRSDRYHSLDNHLSHQVSHTPWKSPRE